MIVPAGAFYPSGIAKTSVRPRAANDIVEQLLTDTKRARDADAAAMNMQLTAWRDAQAANDAFVAGTSEALRSWRQP